MDRINISIKREPKYLIELTAEEIASLWLLCRDAVEKKIPKSLDFFNALEDVRPAGGFKE